MRSAAPLFRRPRSVFCRLRALGPGPTLFIARARGIAGVPAEPASSPRLPGGLQSGLASLQRTLDDHVVGQEAAKEAVLLALLAREHVYIEGPPGIAKTYISELVSASTGLSHWFYQMHRDTRLDEMVGETVIVKSETAAGEVIRQDIVRGGILECELAVLDDISRAPGEALNVLLRILNERKFGSSPNRIPLLSAIATGNPAQDDAYYAEALDPATLDRFALQLRLEGLVGQRQWEAVGRVIDMYSTPKVASEDVTVSTIDRNVVVDAGELVPSVIFGAAVRDKLIEFLRTLRENYRCTEENSLLTDRTFLVKSVRIMKAAAVLDGRLACEPRDLRSMRFLTTFRVPAGVHARIDRIIEDVLAQDAPTSEGDCGADGAEGATSESGVADGNEEEPMRLGGASDGLAPEIKGVTVTRLDSDANAVGKRDPTELNVLPPEATPGPTSDNLQLFLRELRGRLQKGVAAQLEASGGLPRCWHRPRRFAGARDSDPTALALWCEQPMPELPRAQRRTRRDLGGQLAIIRDTSLSMMGPWNGWASLLCPRIVELAQKCKMRVGYLEFNSDVDKFVSGDSLKFFSRDYEALSSRMHYVQCKGHTNFELPLSMALSEFRPGAKHARMQRRSLPTSTSAHGSQHILFLTDGHPSTGDVTVAREIEAARKLGVIVHTIFIGRGDHPPVLDEMSVRTGGSRYAAQLIPGSYDVHIMKRGVQL